MAQITVNDLDETVVQRLIERARSSQRSLQAEVKAILEQAAENEMIDLDTAGRMLDDFRRRFVDRQFSDSAELIREDRER
jgi:antitoxin FitA